MNKVITFKKLPKDVIQYIAKVGKLSIQDIARWRLTCYATYHALTPLYDKYMSETLTIILLSAEVSFSLALTKNGTMLGCGINSYGQLGLGDNKNRSTFTIVPNLDPITQSCTRNGHSLGLTKKGTLLACGNNFNGQLGLGTRLRGLVLIINLVEAIQFVGVGKDA